MGSHLLLAALVALGSAAPLHEHEQDPQVWVVSVPADPQVVDDEARPVEAAVQSVVEGLKHILRSSEDGGVRPTSPLADLAVTPELRSEPDPDANEVSLLEDQVSNSAFTPTRVPVDLAESTQVHLESPSGDEDAEPPKVYPPPSPLDDETPVVAPLAPRDTVTMLMEGDEPLEKNSTIATTEVPGAEQVDISPTTFPSREVQDDTGSDVGAEEQLADEFINEPSDEIPTPTTQNSLDSIPSDPVLAQVAAGVSLIPPAEVSHATNSEPSIDAPVLSPDLQAAQLGDEGAGQSLINEASQNQQDAPDTTPHQQDIGQLGSGEPMSSPESIPTEHPTAPPPVSDGVAPDPVSANSQSQASPAEPGAGSTPTLIPAFQSEEEVAVLNTELLADDKLTSEQEELTPSSGEDDTLPAEEHLDVETEPTNAPSSAALIAAVNDELIDHVRDQQSQSSELLASPELPEQVTSTDFPATQDDSNAVLPEQPSKLHTQAAEINNQLSVAEENPVVSVAMLEEAVPALSQELGATPVSHDAQSIPAASVVSAPVESAPSSESQIVGMVESDTSEQKLPTIENSDNIPLEDQPKGEPEHTTTASEVAVTSLADDVEVTSEVPAEDPSLQLADDEPAPNVLTPQQPSTVSDGQSTLGQVLAAGQHAPSVESGVQPQTEYAEHAEHAYAPEDVAVPAGGMVIAHVDAPAIYTDESTGGDQPSGLPPPTETERPSENAQSDDANDALPPAATEVPEETTRIQEVPLEPQADTTVTPSSAPQSEDPPPGSGEQADLSQPPASQEDTTTHPLGGDVPLALDDKQKPTSVSSNDDQYPADHESDIASTTAIAEPTTPLNEQAVPSTLNDPGQRPADEDSTPSDTQWGTLSSSLNELSMSLDQEVPPESHIEATAEISSQAVGSPVTPSVASQTTVEYPSRVEDSPVTPASPGIEETPITTESVQSQDTLTGVETSTQVQATMDGEPQNIEQSVVQNTESGSPILDATTLTYAFPEVSTPAQEGIQIEDISPQSGSNSDAQEALLAGETTTSVPATAATDSGASATLSPVAHAEAISSVPNAQVPVATHISSEEVQKLNAELSPDITTTPSPIEEFSGSDAPLRLPDVSHIASDVSVIAAINGLTATTPAVESEETTPAVAELDVTTTTAPIVPELPVEKDELPTPAARPAEVTPLEVQTTEQPAAGAGLNDIADKPTEDVVKAPGEPYLNPDEPNRNPYQEEEEEAGNGISQETDNATEDSNKTDQSAGQPASVSSEEATHTSPQQQVNSSEESNSNSSEESQSIASEEASSTAHKERPPPPEQRPVEEAPDNELLRPIPPPQQGADEEQPVAADSPVQVPWLRVRSDVQLRYARTLVRAALHNPAGRAQEVQLALTLPDSGFITGLALESDGKVYKAYVRERKKADGEYQQAAMSGQTAAQVRQTSVRDSAVLSLLVTVAARSSLTVNLTYEELLTRRRGQYQHAVSINPGQQDVDEVRVDMFILESRNLSSLAVNAAGQHLYSVDERDIAQHGPQNFSSGAVTVRRDAGAGHVAHVRLLANREQQQALWPPHEHVHVQAMAPAQAQPAALAISYDVDRSDAASGDLLLLDGYFVHFFAPPEVPPLRKHAIFVLDTSGSMWGHKLRQLQNAMGRILDSLHPDDFFSIVQFASHVTEWSPHTLEVVGLRDKEATLPANRDHINKAKKFINSMEASGGTNIGGALRSAVRLAGKRDYDRWPTYRAGGADLPQPLIIFLTDGLPTVGTLSLGRVLAQIRAQNAEIKAAIFSLSFGSRSNWRFLQRLSLQNNGFARRIYEAGDAAQQLQDFYQEIASPLLANVTFNYVTTKVDGSSVTRRSFPIMYGGSELVVAGRVADGVTALEAEVEAWGAAPGTSAAVGAAPGRRVLRATAEISGLTPPPPPRNGTNKKKGPSKPTIGVLERLWAYLSVKQLLDADLEQHDEDLIAEPIKMEPGLDQPRRRALYLALKYGFVTRITSLVVVTPSRNDSSQTQETAVRPVPADGAERDAEGFPITNKFSELSLSRPPLPGHIPLNFQPLLLSQQSENSTQTLPLTAITWLSQHTDSVGRLRVGASAFSLELPGQMELQRLMAAAANQCPGRSCRPLASCVQPAVASSFMVFRDYFCPLGMYAGVCCSY